VINLKKVGGTDPGIGMDIELTIEVTRMILKVTLTAERGAGQVPAIALDPDLGTVTTGATKINLLTRAEALSVKVGDRKLVHLYPPLPILHL
jgi:hypothetical protein